MLSAFTRAAMTWRASFSSASTRCSTGARRAWASLPAMKAHPRSHRHGPCGPGLPRGRGREPARKRRNRTHALLYHGLQPDLQCPANRFQGPGVELALAHNGNVINALELRDELAEAGCSFTSTSDSEVIGQLLAVAPEVSWDKRVAYAMRRLRGAYSLAVMTKDCLLGIRDPMGSAPAVHRATGGRLGHRVGDVRAGPRRRGVRPRGRAGRGGDDRRVRAAHHLSPHAPGRLRHVPCSSISTSPALTAT